MLAKDPSLSYPPHCLNSPPSGPQAARRAACATLRAHAPWREAGLASERANPPQLHRRTPAARGAACALRRTPAARGAACATSGRKFRQASGPAGPAAAMDQCVTVERELEKVLQKFAGYGQLCERSLEELIQYAGGLRREILQTESTCPGSGPRTAPAAGVGAWVSARRGGGLGVSAKHSVGGRCGVSYCRSRGKVPGKLLARRGCAGRDGRPRGTKGARSAVGGLPVSAPHTGYS